MKLGPPFVRVFLPAVVLGLLAYAASYLLPPTYESSFTLYYPMSAPSSLLTGTKLLPEGQESAVRSLGGALVSPLVGSGTQTSIGILTSRTCLESVVQKLGLDKKWDLTPAKAFKRLKSSISASVDKNGFLSVEAESESPGLCVQILKELYSHLKSRANELTVNVSRRNREFVEERVRDSERKANENQAAMVRLLAQTDQAEFSRVLASYNDFRAKIEDAKLQETIARATLSTSEASLRSLIKESRTYPNSLLTMKYVNGSLDILAGDIQARRLALEDTLARFTKQSAEYKSVSKNLKVLEAFASTVMDVQLNALDRGVSPQFAAAKGELRVLSVRIGEYERLLSKYRAALNESASQSSRLERARGEFNASLSNLAALRNELEVAKIAESRDPSRFELVDPPSEQSETVGPRRTLIAGAIFLLALAFQGWPWLKAAFREPES